MAKHHAFEVAFQGLKLAAVVIRNIGWWNACDFGNDVFDLQLADGFLALGSGQDALRGAGFVNDVDRLVWQVAIVDVFGAEFGSSLQCSDRVFDVVVLLKTRLQAF